MLSFVICFVTILGIKVLVPKEKKKKNPPANAGDAGSSPGPGRSHVPQIN